jgi:Arc/MetJ-type ribon-helix-helix transcriptional regulator
MELTDDEVIRAAMRLLGKRTSERKRDSSRRNAKRPRKRSKRLARTKATVSPHGNGSDATVKK